MDKMTTVGSFQTTGGGSITLTTPVFARYVRLTIDKISNTSDAVADSEKSVGLSQLSVVIFLILYPIVFQEITIRYQAKRK